MTLIFQILSIFSVVYLCHSHAYFRDKIPNGKNVPNPCEDSTKWNGVGHYQTAGGGPRNPFGLDFVANGNKWTKELCAKDSDGDGKSNGAELGDPNCQWSEGATPQLTTGLSHPGICEPVTTPECVKKNENYGAQFCKPKAECEGMKNSSTLKLTFTKSTVPARATSYHCQAFTVPEDIYFYASEMIIDNAEIMHHALLFGCASKPEKEYFASPRECGMSSASCGEIISVWTLGAQFDCLHKDIHFSMGPSQAVKYVMLQFHWNNPQLKTGYTDASAMVLHYSQTPRQYEAGVLIAGQMYMKLQPGEANIKLTHHSGPDCSRLVALKNNVFVTTSLFHMHLAGRKGWVGQYRDGKLLRYLSPPGSFEYNEPVFQKYDETVELKQGDELRMECDYSTADKQYPVYFGEGTNDEMCFVFLRVYPKENVRSQYAMMNVGPIDSCVVNLPTHGGINGKANQLLSCNIQNFIKELYEPHKLTFDEFCKTSHTFCRQDCKEIAQKFLQHDCWQSYPYIYMKRYRFYVHEGTTMRNIDEKMEQCRMEVEREKARKEAMDETRRQVEKMLNVAVRHGSLEIVAGIWILMILLGRVL